MADNFPTPGEVFEERYRISSVINRGGFGRVYKAQQLELNRDVAIKVLQPIMRDGMDADEELRRLEVVRKRFDREAQLVSQLRDSHTVVMHDYGTTDAGLLYMVLEYIAGLPLDKAIEEEGALAPERAVKIARQVLWSLQEAHALNMLHRDVKPQNIMLYEHAGRTDQVKVLDFGLAKSAESAEFKAEDPDLTGDQVILGTPRYMSPEQIRGEALGPTTDIYSLGLVIYEMLTGQKAVTGDSTMNTLARHLNDVPIRLPVDLVVPGSLRDIVDRMLLKDPTQRIQSAEEALDALEFWNSASNVMHPETDPLAPPPDFVEERRRQTLVWMATGMVSLFLIFAVLSAMISDDPPEAAEMSASETELEHPQPRAPAVPTATELHVEAEEVVAAVPDAPDPKPVKPSTPKPEEDQPEDEPSAGEEPAPVPADEEPPEPAPDAPTAPDTIDLEPEVVPAAATTTTRNNSTKTDNSGKKKKPALKIGILK